MNCKSLKTCQNLRINITKHHKNATHCFTLNGKELLIHWLTIADVLRDVFCDVYFRSLNVLHFRMGHKVIETPLMLIGICYRIKCSFTNKSIANKFLRFCNVSLVVKLLNKYQSQLLYSSWHLLLFLDFNLCTQTLLYSVPGERGLLQKF